MMLAFSIYGCTENKIDEIAKQAEFLQANSSEFVSACSGTLSMKTTYTGDPKKPMIFEMSCDDADKTHAYFKKYSDEGLDDLKNVIRDMNGIDTVTKDAEKEVDAKG